MNIQYRYESTQRPVSIGTCPTKGMVGFWNYRNGRQLVYVQETPTSGKSIQSWGNVNYNRKLTEKEMADYELVYGGEEIAI